MGIVVMVRRYGGVGEGIVEGIFVRDVSESILV